MVQLSPAFTPATSPATSAATDPADRLAARRALIASRFAALSRANGRARGYRPAGVGYSAGQSSPTSSASTFRPVPRASVLAGLTAEPILFPHERARVRLEVEMSRDHEEWTLGKACNGWLILRDSSN